MKERIPWASFSFGFRHEEIQVMLGAVVFRK
jgi:hypothetical protein